MIYVNIQLFNQFLTHTEKSCQQQIYRIKTVCILQVTQFGQTDTIKQHDPSHYFMYLYVQTYLYNLKLLFMT